MRMARPRASATVRVQLFAQVVLRAISEHVENAGVHSGDATLVLPAQDLDEETVQKVEQAAFQIANALNVTGPFNIQFIAKDKAIKVRTLAAPPGQEVESKISFTPYTFVGR